MSADRPLASWRQRRQTMAKLRNERRVGPRNDRYKRRDLSRAKRRQRWVGRRHILSHGPGAAARVMTRRPASWLANHARRPAAAGWRRLTRIRYLLAERARNVALRLPYWL